MACSTIPALVDSRLICLNKFACQTVAHFTWKALANPVPVVTVLHGGVFKVMCGTAAFWWWQTCLRPTERAPCQLVMPALFRLTDTGNIADTARGEGGGRRRGDQNARLSHKCLEKRIPKRMLPNRSKSTSCFLHWQLQHERGLSSLGGFFFPNLVRVTGK